MTPNHTLCVGVSCPSETRLKHFYIKLYQIVQHANRRSNFSTFTLMLQQKHQANLSPIFTPYFWSTPKNNLMDELN